MKYFSKVFLTVFTIYLLCYAFRGFEYFILRTDQTRVGEAIVHKLIGIVVLFVAAKLLLFTAREIGFTKENGLDEVIFIRSLREDIAEG